METKIKSESKVVGIRGASGFLGKAISEALIKNGFRVIGLRRDFTLVELKECNIVINLAGKNINCRWNAKNRKEIYDSRILTTGRIASTFLECGANAPFLLISVSATGIYPSTNGSHPEPLLFDEDSMTEPDTFLSKVCNDWEREALKATPVSRVAVIRLGVVIDKSGGAFPKLLLPFRMKIAARISSGNQPFSWISLKDVIGSILYIIENNSMEGIFNLTSPEITTNREITRVLSKRYKTLIPFVIPTFILRLIFGKSHILLTEGAKVYPKRLLESGYKFIEPNF
ncbi:MAG: TIGR01777 family oxidoreductase [Rikenellaceae bacterium]|nr:TIGR01777 family oxidoreductase [Rikenellaceae bacterium]